MQAVALHRDASKPREAVRRFTPLPKQRAFLESTAPELLYSGAFGAGKSRVGCEKAHFLSSFYPGNVGLICRKVFADLTSTTLVSLFDEVLAPSDILAHNRQEHRITVRSNDPKRPSTIWYRGLDRPQGIGSMNLGWVFADEGIEFEEKDWVMLDGRLRYNRVPFHQIFSATNPGAPSHWLHKRFYQEHPVDEQGRAVRHVVESNALENQHNPASYRARLERFRGVHRDRYVLGKWVGFEGLVYPDFNPLVHVIDPFPIPPHWARARSFDFGTSNPFVCQWWAIRPEDDAAFLYREIYMTGRRATEHAIQVRSLSITQGPDGAQLPETYQFSVADHDAGDRMDLDAHGIHTIPATKDIRQGIQAMANRLATTDPTTGETRPPKVFLFRNALVEVDPRLEQEGRPTCTAEEFGAHKWAKGAHDTDKDVPLDKDNHGLDAARYFVMQWDRVGAARPTVTNRNAQRAPRNHEPGSLYGVNPR